MIYFYTYYVDNCFKNEIKSSLKFNKKYELFV